MAERRKWSTGKRIGFGLAQGGQQAFDYWLKDILANKSAERVAQRQEAGDARTAARMVGIQRQQQAYDARKGALDKLPELVDRLGPEGAAHYVGLQLGQKGEELNLYPDAPDPLTGSSWSSPDDVGTGEFEREQQAGQQQTQTAIGASQTPVRRKLESSVGKNISAATEPEQLNADDINSQILAADPRAVPKLGEPGMTIGGLRPDAYEYVDRANVKRNELLTKPQHLVKGTDTLGRSYEQLLSTEDMGKPVYTSPSAQQQGINEGAKQTEIDWAKLEPIYQAAAARAKGQADAIVENMTRGAKAATAGAVAGATEDAKMAPGRVSARVDEAIRSRPAEKPSGEENRAAANFAMLTNAHGVAEQLEAEGASIANLSQWATGDGWGAPLANQFVDPLERQYAQVMRDFTSTFGLIRSGVAVSESERPNFVASLFATKGDDDATVKQKVATRLMFTSAMQAMIGKATPVAAQIFGDAVNRGQIPVEMLTKLTFTPEMRTELAKVLRIPGFTLDGQPRGQQ